MHMGHRRHIEFRFASPPRAQWQIATTVGVLLTCVAAAFGAEVERTWDSVPDATVVRHDGAMLRFRRDVVGEQIALISFFYVDCRFICVPQGRMFARLAKALGNRVGREVVFVSISLVPEQDSVDDLKAWARHFEPVQGWSVVTGEPAEVHALVRALVGSVGPRNTHDAVVLIVDGKARTIERAYGFDETAMFLRKIEQRLAARAACAPSPRASASSTATLRGHD